jgi:hypothetical protein
MSRLEAPITELALGRQLYPKMRYTSVCNPSLIARKTSTHNRQIATSETFSIVTSTLYHEGADLKQITTIQKPSTTLFLLIAIRVFWIV